MSNWRTALATLAGVVLLGGVAFVEYFASTGEREWSGPCGPGLGGWPTDARLCALKHACDRADPDSETCALYDFRLRFGGRRAVAAVTVWRD